MTKCADCGKEIPPYVGNIWSGFVKPSPPASARPAPGQLTREELASITMTQGPTGMTVTAHDIAVCADCYVTEYLRVNPGAEAPVMPRVDG